MTLNLQQAICLSLAGGFAIVAPPSLSRNQTFNEPEQDSPPADRAAPDPARDDDAPNKRARNRSRKTS